MEYGEKRGKEKRQNTEKKSYLIKGFSFVLSLCLHGPPVSEKNLVMESQAETSTGCIQFRVSGVSGSYMCVYIFYFILFFNIYLKRRV